MMNRLSLINKVISNKKIVVKLFFNLKYSTPKSFYFYFVVILIKLLGLLILTTNFLTKSTNKYSYYFPEILRSATCFGIFVNAISYNVYICISIFLFLLIAISAYLFYFLYKNSKTDEHFLASHVAEVINKILSKIFILFLILSNHIIEFSSVTFLIQFNPNTMANIDKYRNMPIFNLTNKSINIIAIIVNTITIIFMNFFLYYSFQILNEPFFNSKFPLKFRYTSFSIFLYMFLSNLQMIHFIEIFITSEVGMIYFKSVLLAVIYLLILTSFFKSLSRFNFNSVYTIIINFILAFSIFSSSLEILLVSSKSEASSIKNFLFVLACKIILSLSFLVIYSFISKNMFLSKINFTLFKSYDGKISDSEIESLYGLVDLIIKMQKNDLKSFKEIIDLILTHRLTCVYDYCKCNLISSFKKETLNEDLFYILEMIFTKLNLGQDKTSIFLFSEYLAALKNMNLFSYALINTFINKNFRKINNLDLVEIYSICINFIIIYYHKLSEIKEFSKFSKVYKNIKLIKSYDKAIMKFTDNFETFLNFKEKLDNTLKFNGDHSKIDSYAFENLSELIVGCKRFKAEYKLMKQKIKKDFSKKKCTHVELSYKLHNFFMLFNKKVPYKIKDLIVADSVDAKLYKKNIKKYFENQLNKLLSINKNNVFNIIIEINNIFKIKYISSKLCDLLCYEQSKLLGDDLHSIFPKQLKELHKKVLLHYFLIKKQMYFEKTTFAFTSTNQTIPVELKVATFPNLEKNLQAIVSLNLLDKIDKRIYQFLISHEYEVFAVSKNFEQDYGLNYESIENSKINILKLFDINEMIQTKFVNTLNHLAEIKYEKQLESLYNLSNFLFNMKTVEDVNNFGIIGLQNTNKNDEDKKIEKKLLKKNQNNLNQIGSQSEYNVDNFTSANNNANNYQIYIAPPKMDNQPTENKENTNLFENNSDLLSSNINFFSNNGNITQGGPVEFKNNLKLSSLGTKRATLGQFRGTTLGYKHAEIEEISMLQQSKKGKKKIGNFSNNKLENEDNSVDSAIPNVNFNKESSNNKVSSGINMNNMNSINYADSTHLENCRHFFTVISKHDVISNFEKIRNRCYDMHLDEVYYIKITDSIKKMRMNIGTVTIPGTNQKGVYGKAFDIKVELRVMNDVPFFVIKILDNFSTIQNEKQGIPVEKLSYMTFNSDKFVKNLRSPITNNTKRKSVFALEEEKNSEINKNLKEENNSYIDLTPSKRDDGFLVNSKQMRIFHREQTNHMLPINIKKKSSFIDNSTKINESKSYYNKLFCIIILFLIFSLFLTCLTYYFKEYSLKASYSIFSVCYYNSLQRSSLFFLHSSLITFIMKLGNLTDLEYSNKYITEEDILDLIALRSYEHRENYKIFYDKLVYNDYNMLPILNLINKQVIFNRTLLTWENIIHESNFNIESDFIVSNTKMLSLGSDFTSLKEDIKNYFLFDKYLKKRGQPQNSEYSEVIYFADENIPFTFSDIIQQVHDLNTKKLSDFNNLWKLVILISQVFEIVVSIFLIIFIYCVLYNYDKKLFQILVKMFVNLGKDPKSAFKSPIEIHIMKNRLKQYKVLLKVFNRNNIKLFKETVKNPFHLSNTKSNKILSKENYMKSLNNFEPQIFDQGDSSLNTFDLSQTDKKLNDVSKYNSKIIPAYSKNRSKNISYVNEFSMNTSNKGLLGLNSNSVFGSLNMNPNNIKEVKDSNTLNSSSFSIKNNLIKGSVIIDDGSSLTEKMTKNEINQKKKNKSMNVINTNATIKIITNKRVLMKTEHHQLFIIKIAKILIISIFFAQIVLLLINLVMNNIYFEKIKVTSEISETVLARIPVMIKIFNFLRLDIISNDFSSLGNIFENNFQEYVNLSDNLVNKMNKFNKILPLTSKYLELINLPIDNDSNINVATEICETNVKCKEFIEMKDGINSKGVTLALQTVMQTLSNTYKDYISSDFTNFDVDSVKKCFYNKDFFNVNIQSEYVLDKVNKLFSVYLKEDVQSIYEGMKFINHLLGILKIIFCLIILIYIVFAFFAQLNKYQSFIAYSAEKFNRALFDISMDVKERFDE